MKGISIGIITYKTDKGYAQIHYFEKLSKVASVYNIPLFVFSVNDVDLKNRRIHGLWYSPENKNWERKWTSFPTIVYDHVRYHPTTQFKKYVQLRQSGQLNFSYNGYSHKLGVAQYLSTFPDLKNIIPESEKIENHEEMLTFIDQGEALLKPIHGTGGRDIYLVQKDHDEVIVKGKGDMPKRMNKLELRKFIDQLLDKEAYLIQRRIPILYNGRTCDTRVLIQKDQYGKWSLTGMGTRIGKQNRIVSNLAKGASAMRTDQFIEQFIGKPTEPILHEITETGLKIAERLEQKYGNFVEFGLDIGITPDGAFQLIEANSKPDRKIFIKTNQPKQYKQAILKPFQYHLYLCKQIQY